VLIACSNDFKIVVDPVTAGSQFSVTGTVVSRANNSSWSITGVYWPHEDDSKAEFMQEIRHIKAVVQTKWMILGDFNLIASTADKSNDNLNLRLLGQFRALIQDLELIDYPLFGRKYTWSSEREFATHTRIDRVSKDWDVEYPQFQLTPASSTYRFE
jgi:hypothetical protein